MNLDWDWNGAHKGKGGTQLDEDGWGHGCRQGPGLPLLRSIKGRRGRTEVLGAQVGRELQSFLIQPPLSDPLSQYSFLAVPLPLSGHLEGNNPISSKGMGQSGTGTPGPSSAIWDLSDPI